MKLRTHYVFSLGLLSLLDSFILNDFLEVIIISGIISVTANNVIDYLGHEIRGKYVSRTPRTHTLPRSIGWGLLTSLPIVLASYFLLYSPTELMLITILDGVIVGPSHMLLDIFTEKGIYHKVNGKWRRIALAHFSYDNPIVNGLAILLYASKKGLKVCWQFSYRLHCLGGCIPKGIERC
jgi:hypothetical protein